MSARDFVDAFLSNRVRMHQVADSKQTVNHNKYDMQDFESILEELKELSVAEDRLVEVAPTGSPALADTFMSLMKATPKLKEATEIRPSHLVNHSVMGEVMGLQEYEDLRIYSTGDEVESGLAATKMEPRLEDIFGKLKAEQEMAEQLEQLVMEAEDQEADSEALEQAAKNGEIKPTDYQKQKARIAQQEAQRSQQMKDLADKIDQGLSENRSNIRSNASAGLKEAEEDAQNLDSMANSWGLEPGALTRLPAKRRVDLAQRMDNEKFRKLAQLIGKLQRLAIAEQHKKVKNIPEETFDIEMGNDLTRVLPTEMLTMNDPVLSTDFFRKFTEGGLLQYKLKGSERVAKGGIVYCMDGSGSMGGAREVWAKAVGLALLHIARMQKREFYAIIFGSTGEYVSYLFPPKSTEVTMVNLDGTEETFDLIDGTLSFAETFWGGGTSFTTPLDLALAKLNEENAKEGAIKGDIVLATDGQCGVPDQWLTDYKKKQQDLGFKIFGIVIDGARESEPLFTIADERVVTIADLYSGDEIKDMLREL